MAGVTPPPAWVADYIGLPFADNGRTRDGVDCFGLLRLVLSERFGIHLPAFAGAVVSTEDAAEIARIIRGEMQPWAEIPKGHARAGDVVLMRLRNQPCHVGLVVSPVRSGAWMLHAEVGTDSCLDSYDGARWRGRVIGIFRYKGVGE
jgi:cell wall-associated NlpC family hydrolase